MITGIHATMFTSQAEAVRAFFRDVLQLPSVDAGGGWLVFALPPAELGIHPAEQNAGHEVYLMCDDIEASAGELRGKGVEIGPVTDEGFGLMARLRLPDGSDPRGASARLRRSGRTPLLHLRGRDRRAVSGSRTTLSA